jgi:hypothetical protein
MDEWAIESMTHNEPAPATYSHTTNGGCTRPAERDSRRA